MTCIKNCIFRSMSSPKQTSWIRPWLGARTGPNPYFNDRNYYTDLSRGVIMANAYAAPAKIHKCEILSKKFWRHATFEKSWI